MMKNAYVSAVCRTVSSHMVPQAALGNGVHTLEWKQIDFVWIFRYNETAYLSAVEEWSPAGCSGMGCSHIEKEARK